MPSQGWIYTVEGVKDAVDPYDERDDTLEVKRDKIIAVIKASDWYKDQDEDSELHDALDELAQADTVEWMDNVLFHIYDLADDDRAWLE